MERLFVILLLLTVCYLHETQAKKGAKKIICNKQADILLILDRSVGKLTGGEQEETMHFWMDLVGMTNAGLNDSRVAVISVGKTARVEQRFDGCETTDLPCLLDPIKNITFDAHTGEVDLLGALQLAKTQIFTEENGDRRNKGNAIIIASNNVPIDMSPELSDIARSFRIRDTSIYLATVEGKGNDRRRCSYKDADNEIVRGDPAYNELVSDPDDKHCMSVTNAAKLKTKTYRIMKDVCDTLNVGRAFIPPILAPGEVCFMKADVTLMIDRSGSITDGGKWEEWVRMRHFVSDIINRLQVGIDDTRVAIVSFGNEPYTRKHIDLDDCRTTECLHEVLWSIDSPNGQTATAKAFRIADEEIYVPSGGDRTSALDIIILVTDGKPFPAQPQLLEMVDIMKLRKNMKILGVGVTDDVDFHMMEQIVSYPYKDFYFQSADFSTLLSEVEGLQTQTCLRFTTGPLPLLECNADIALAVDNSGSITEHYPYDENWDQLKTFLYGLVDSVQIGSTASQVALVSFSDRVELGLRLNTCNTGECVKRAIGGMTHPEGATHTTEALEVLHGHVFQESGGDRPNYRNILILVTDGRPSPYNQYEFQRAVQSLKSRGTIIYGIGVTRNVSMDIMKSMVSSPWDEHYYPVDMFNSLANKDFYYGLITRACSQERPTTTPMMTPAPPTAIPISDCIKDVVILVDRSQDVLHGGDGLGNWRVVQEFLMRYVAALDVGPSRTRVGIVSFNDASRPELLFNKCLNDQCVRNTIFAIDTPSGLRSFKTAFQVARDYMLISNSGDRDYVPDVIVLVAVGRPNPDESDIVEFVDQNIKSRNVKIIGVGITERADSYLMRALVSSPSEYNYLPILEFNNLFNVVPALKEETCRVEARPTVKPVTCGADIALIVDRSGSITNPPRRMLNWEDLRSFVLRLIDTIDVGPTTSRVSITYYANQVHTKAYFKDCRDKDCLKQKIWSIPDPYGETNTTGALAEADRFIFSPDNGDRPNPDIILLITDGKPNPYNEVELINILNMLKARGITIFGIGVTDNIDDLTMRMIVSEPWQNHYYPVESFSALSMNKLYQIILENACGGSRPLPGLPSPRPGPEIQFGECSHDILIMVDRSQSVTSRGETYAWGYIKQYLKTIVSSLELGKGTTRLALLDFSDYTTMHFYLRGCDSNRSQKECMNDRIDGMKIPNGGTKVGAAFSVAKEYVFTPFNGARDNSNKVILLLTDGVTIARSAGQSESATADAAYFRSLGYRIMIVAIGSDINEVLFNNIVSQPTEQNLITLPNYASLAANHDRILVQACNNDFRSTTGRVPEDPVLLSACVAGSDLIVAIDTSLQQFQQIPDWLTSLLRELPIGQGLVRVGIVTYAATVNVVKHLNDRMTVNQIENQLRSTRSTPREETNTADVLARIKNGMLREIKGDRPDRHNVVLLIAGKASPSRMETISMGKQLQSKAKVLSVGVGPTIDPAEMEQISTDRPDYVNSVNLMPRGVLLNRICSAGPSLKCEEIVDLAFIVDPAMAGTAEDFDLIKQFMVNMVTSYVGGQDGAHFAIVTVGGFTRVLFGLEQHDYSSDVVTTIRDELEEEPLGLLADLATGLQLVNTEVFGRGSRPDVKRVVVILSSGEPSRNPYRSRSEARRLKDEGIKVIVLTISQGEGLFELDEIASPPAKGEGNTNIVAAGAYDNLSGVLNDVVAKAC